ncbi:MAG: c-type cytochrome [Solirubrobacterales bacterium]
MTASRIFLLVFACVAVAGVAACGGTNTDATGTNPGDGKQIFSDAGCGGCHTFKPSGSGGTSGPALDSTTLSSEEIAAQIRSGGGGMPGFEGNLTPEQIDAVTAFIVGSSSIN